MGRRVAHPYGEARRPFAMLDIVVLIPTRNRWASLQACLESLQAQEVPAASVAIRVVDNGSNDGSLACLQAYAAGGRRIPVEVISLPDPGKSAALNRGLEGLECEVVAFSDDDMRMDRRWLLSIWEHFRCCRCAGLHGRVTLDLPGPRPAWFTDRCAELLGATAWRGASNSVLGLQGANMAVRAAQIRRIGGFREDMGPRGSHYASAEDIEWSHRLLDLGETLCYCPEVLSHHVVGAGLVSRAALWMRQFEYARRETVEGLHERTGPTLWGELWTLAGALVRRTRDFAGFDYGLELAGRCGRIAGLMERWIRRGQERQKTR